MRMPALEDSHANWNVSTDIVTEIVSFQSTLIRLIPNSFLFSSGFIFYEKISHYL